MPQQDEVQNPVTEYVRAPFQRQSQPWPGLDGKMVPVPDSGKQIYQGSGRLLGSQTPLKRPGQPAELAPAYVLLASQESSFATGQVYGVSGGMGQP